MSDHPSSRTPVGRFATDLLASDLPALDPNRLRSAVGFVERRVAGLPSIMRFGVVTIGWFVDGASRLVGRSRTRRLVLRLRLPLISEYPRLVRSLGYAYVWETWPDTGVDGRAGGQAR
jgi:hypothetical protein